jgi:hypothetical protein
LERRATGTGAIADGALAGMQSGFDAIWSLSLEGCVAVDIPAIGVAATGIAGLAQGGAGHLHRTPNGPDRWLKTHFLKL